MVLLPLEPGTEIGNGIPLHTDAPRHAVVVLVRRRANVRSALALRVVTAELAVGGKLICDRQHADGDELPYLRLDARAHAGAARLRLAQIVIARLDGKVAIYLVAGQ